MSGARDGARAWLQSARGRPSVAALAGASDLTRPVRGDRHDCIARRQTSKTFEQFVREEQRSFAAQVARRRPERGMLCDPGIVR